MPLGILRQTGLITSLASTVGIHESYLSRIAVFPVLRSAYRVNQLLPRVRLDMLDNLDWAWVFSAGRGSDDLTQWSQRLYFL